MSTHDPSTLLVADGDDATAPSPLFSETLLGHLIGELERPRRRALPRRRSVRTLLLAAALALLLAGAATATYLIARPSSAGTDPKPGALTLIVPNTNAAEKVVEVLPNGRLTVVWRCPGNVFCGDVESVAWAPDGRHVAFSLTELGGRSAYIGLHIVTIRSGREVHIPSLPLAHPMAPQPKSILDRLWRQERRRLGCFDPSQLAWSPDSRRLAYACLTTSGQRAIFTIGRNGTGSRRVPTGKRAAYWPSWSPDGKHLVFATGKKPEHSTLYVVGTDGSGRRLLKRGATAPDWSPDGTAIAYQAGDGVRIVSPRGADLSPPGTDGKRGSIDVDGKPAWSPDGSQLAVSTTRGVELVTVATGAHSLVTHHSGLTLFDGGRSTWYPGPAAPAVNGQAD